MEWKKIFASNVSVKGLVSRIYRWFKTQQWKHSSKHEFKNGQRISIDFFFKEVIQMASVHMKRCLTSLFIREIQSKNYSEIWHHTIGRAMSQKETNKQTKKNTRK